MVAQGVVTAISASTVGRDLKKHPQTLAGEKRVCSDHHALISPPDGGDFGPVPPALQSKAAHGQL